MMTFEEAYERLEKIVERISSESVSLDESLKLYEEADALIQSCQKRLTDAEQKIEILVKNREGNLAIDENGRPATEPYQGARQSHL